MKICLSTFEFEMGDRCQEHTFSIELNSKKHVRNIVLTKKIASGVLFEGALGELEEITLTEGRVLEFKGGNGVLRLDICEEELMGYLLKKKEEAEEA